MAERVGFEPTVHLLGVQPISSRPRYSHFGTSPFNSRIRFKVQGSRLKVWKIHFYASWCPQGMRLN